MNYPIEAAWHSRDSTEIPIRFLYFQIQERFILRLLGSFLGNAHTLYELYILLGTCCMVNLLSKHHHCLTYPKSNLNGCEKRARCSFILITNIAFLQKYILLTPFCHSEPKKMIYTRKFSKQC